MTTVENAANEATNEKFRADDGLGFLDIPKLMESVMEARTADLKTTGVTLEDILNYDAWAQQFVEEASAKVSASAAVLKV